MQYLSLADLCCKLGVSRVQLWELRKRPDFPAALLVTPRNPRYREDEIDAWMMARPRAGADGEPAEPATERPSAGA
ncbi:MAG: AlpA family phage regulatory protein [Acidobacteria bacterium]|nr:AlpA family phage regulatory protein [Acidobacteriota bacterium]